MGVSERVMAAGSWSLKLRADTPQWVLDLLDLSTGMFGQLIITPGDVEGITSAAELRKISSYVGVLRTRPGVLEFAGASALVLLGDEDGKGPVKSTASSVTAQQLPYWVGQYTPGNGIVAGTTYGTTATWSGPVPSQITYRAAMDMAVAGCGGEFRLSVDSSGNLAIDSGAVDSLYGATPASIVVARDGNRELGIIGLKTVDAAWSSDGEDYTTSVNVIARGDGGATVSTATAGSVPYYAPGGAATVVMTRVVDSSGTTAADAAAVATQQLALFNKLHEGYQLRVESSGVVGFTGGPSGVTTTAVRCGDWIYVYAPDRNILDVANQVVYRGEVMFPKRLRIMGISWPIMRGCGVYFVSPDAAQTLTRLSDWVEWESGDTTFVVGSQERPLMGSTPTGTSSPYGDLPTTLVSDARTSWTPSMKGSGSNPTLTSPTGEWRRMGTDVWGSFEITINNPGTGTYKITGPASLRGTRQRTVGHGFCYDVTAPGTYWPFTLRSVGDGTADMYMFSAGAIGGTGTNFSQTSPFTFATGDYIEGQFFAEAATS